MNDKILKINAGDIVEMKKDHPCGGRIFKILRAGSDVRVICEKCGRDMTLDRVKFEKAIKKMKFKMDNENEIENENENIEICEADEITDETDADGKKENSFSAFFMKIAKNPYSYLAFAFILPVMIMYLIYLSMEIHPFGVAK